MPYKDRTSEAYKEKQRSYNRKYYLKNRFAQINRNSRKKKQISDYIKKYKEFRGCMDCNIKFPSYVLDLDHRDPSLKKFTPSRLSRNGSWDKMVEELQKCDVVCANCHRIRTHKRKQYHGKKAETETNND